MWMVRGGLCVDGEGRAVWMVRGGLCVDGEGSMYLFIAGL